MRTEKIMSVYNLQDEGKLGAVLNKVEGLEFEKIGSEAYDETETARYYMCMEEVWTSGQLLESISKFVQENEGAKIRFCNPGRAKNLAINAGKIRG